MSERRSDGESPLSIAVGFLTDVGRQRERNEDAYYVYVPYPGEPNRSFVDGLFAVADGMGGHDAGDVASRIAVETVKESFLDPGAEAAPDPHGFARQLDQLFQEINRRLVDYARQQKMDRGIGSTLTLAALRGSDLQIAHVGDTRCYRLRTGNLERLTEDHTWVAQQRKAGLLTPEEEASHPKRNLLTQALGTETGVRVDLHTESVEAGDRYLICCDGLHGLIEEPSIARVLGEENDPQQALRRLVRQANDAGGNDNITGVTFYLTEAAAAKAGPEVTAPRAQVEPGEVVTVPPSHIEIPAPVESRSSRWPIWGGLAVLLVAVAAVGWLWLAPRLQDRPENTELGRLLDGLADGEVLGLLLEDQEGAARRMLQGRLGAYPSDPIARELLRRLDADSAAMGRLTPAVMESTRQEAGVDSNRIAERESTRVE